MCRLSGTAGRSAMDFPPRPAPCPGLQESIWARQWAAIEGLTDTLGDQNGGPAAIIGPNRPSNTLASDQELSPTAAPLLFPTPQIEHGLSSYQMRCERPRYHGTSWPDPTLRRKSQAFVFVRRTQLGNSKTTGGATPFRHNRSFFVPARLQMQVELANGPSRFAYKHNLKRRSPRSLEDRPLFFSSVTNADGQSLRCRESLDNDSHGPCRRKNGQRCHSRARFPLANCAAGLDRRSIPPTCANCSLNPEYLRRGDAAFVSVPHAHGPRLRRPVRHTGAPSWSAQFSRRNGGEPPAESP